jgi:hypothetical protein
MRARERSEALLLTFACDVLERAEANSLRSPPHPALRATFSRRREKG